MDSEDTIYKTTYREKTMQLHNETNSMKTAQLMREIANITFHQAVLTSKSSQTPLMLLQNKLQSYRDHMLGTSNSSSSPSPMDIIQQECDNLLTIAASSETPKCPKPEYIPMNLDRFASVFNKPLSCQGKFLQNTHDKVTDDDVKLLFDKKAISTESRTLKDPLKTQEKISVCTDTDKAAFTRKPTVTSVDNPSMSNQRQQTDNDPNLLKQFYNKAVSTSCDSRLKLNKKTDTQHVSKWMKMDSIETQVAPSAANVFRTARQELVVNHAKRYGYAARLPEPATTSDPQHNSNDTRGSVRSKYVPVLQQVHQNEANNGSNTASDDIEMQDERLRNIDPKMVELIKSEIMEHQSSVGWNDIAGLEFAKSIIKEAVVWPLLRPDIFTGLRQPPRGILLFGPPGTGKTLIGKCIASQSKSTFFSISASSLTSKWIGDGEKMVRALFAVASVHQPAVVFIDEIDSLLCQRSETEHESSRRLKTEFLVQLDGAATNDTERILIVGATNRPQELDEAARRRLVKRLYIPLPELDARVQILQNLLKKTNQTDVTDAQMKEIGRLTDGFSGADMKQLCHEASMGPIRSISMEQMEHINLADVRPVNYSDFEIAMTRVRTSVSPDDLLQYIKWDRTYGSGLPQT